MKTVLLVLFGLIVMADIASIVVFWMMLAIGDTDVIRKVVKKPCRYDNLDTEDYIKFLWWTLFLPVIYLFKFIKHGLVPTIKFIIKFLVWPIKYLFSLIKINTKESLKDKIGKFIVKTFKL